MKGTVVRTALKRIASALAVIAFVAGMSWFFWPNSETPKRSEFQVNRQVIDTPKRHIEPTMRADLQSALNEQGYTLSKTTTHDTEDSQRTYQIWTSAGKPQVELSDFGSKIYGIKTVSFDGGAGTWKNFWCSPTDKNERLLYTINFSKEIRNEIKDGTATLTSDITTPSGMKYVRWSTLICRVSNS